MVNVTKSVTHPPRSIIVYIYDDYLATYKAKLLSYVVEVDMWLGEHFNFFV